MKKLKFRCPFCGFLIYENDFKKSVESEVFVQIFGGRYPHSKKGIMEYHKIDTPDVIMAYKTMILNRLRDIARSFGYVLERLTIPSILTFHGSRVIEISPRIEVIRKIG